ncbi:hypothetical protein BGZ81_009674 [Podila clonocystis]|nr:hypothetical protein BGZ81_009674 [Podila clonocystis]
MSSETEVNLEKPKVLIVGAGIGGITLGILLAKAGIEFAIYERAQEVKPLGSAISFGTAMRPLFEQLGIWDEFQALGKPYNFAHILNEDLSPAFLLDRSDHGAFAGWRKYLISRSELYDLLWRQLPKESVHMGKKVLSFEQNHEGVMIRCSDNMTYHGDILVGADGAYSGVRQHLFKALKENKKLPASDDVPLPFSTVCLVGQTKVLDPEEFPDLKEEESRFSSVFGSGDKYSLVTGITKNNKVCYMVLLYLDKQLSKEHATFQNSEWGPEAAEAMCKEVRHFLVPGGKDGKTLTLGDYFDRTPKGLISKVMLEEKVFDTWSDGRTVLLGDACHKFNPAGVAGALTAIEDATALANWIATLESRSVGDLDLIFKEYHAERHPVAKKTYARSQALATILGKGHQGSFEVYPVLVAKKAPHEGYGDATSGVVPAAGGGQRLCEACLSS